MIPTCNVHLTTAHLMYQFQSRNRETYDSNFTAVLCEASREGRCRFNLVIEKLMIPTAGRWQGGASIFDVSIS